MCIASEDDMCLLRKLLIDKLDLSGRPSSKQIGLFGGKITTRTRFVFTFNRNGCLRIFGSCVDATSCLFSHCINKDFVPINFPHHSSLSWNVSWQPYFGLPQQNQAQFLWVSICSRFFALSSTTVFFCLNIWHAGLSFCRTVQRKSEIKSTKPMHFISVFLIRLYWDLQQWKKRVPKRIFCTLDVASQQ